MTSQVFVDASCPLTAVLDEQEIERSRTNMATLNDLVATEADLNRMTAAFQLCHGALLCIGGTNSNWSAYARKVADEAAVLVLSSSPRQEKP